MRLSRTGRRSRAHLAEIRDAHKGETCVILGNGPSLRDFDVSTLDGIPAFCLNRGYLLWERTGRSPAYYVAVNDLVIEQFSDEIAKLDSQAFLPWLHRERFKDSRGATFFETRIDEPFLTDPRRGVAPGATVTIAALQLAFHMGFTTVILLGVDHRFEYNGLPHDEVRQEGADPNHFRSDYFGHGRLWNLPDLDQSERGYAAARDAFRRDGRQIINATDGTDLDVFDRGELSEVLLDV